MAKFKSHVRAIVVNCLRVNIRKAPSLDADIITTINALEKITVYRRVIVGDFYKVILDGGIEGYCHRKYLTLIEESEVEDDDEHPEFNKETYRN